MLSIYNKTKIPTIHIFFLTLNFQLFPSHPSTPNISTD